MDPLPDEFGVLWFPDEATHGQFQQFCSDGHAFGSFAEWQAKAEAAIQTQQRQGIKLRKVQANLAAFARFCEVHSCLPDSRARTLFAAMQLCDDSKQRN